MDNLEQFLANYPFKLFIEEHDWFDQTVEEATVMIQKAQDRRERRCAKRSFLEVCGGFPPYVPNHRDVNYTSQRGTRRRYQLGRD